jgi:hypothetical protein
MANGALDEPQCAFMIAGQHMELGQVGNDRCRVWRTLGCRGSNAKVFKRLVAMAKGSSQQRADRVCARIMPGAADVTSCNISRASRGRPAPNSAAACSIFLFQPFGAPWKRVSGPSFSIDAQLIKFHLSDARPCDAAIHRTNRHEVRRCNAFKRPAQRPK